MNDVLTRAGSTPLKQGCRLYDLVLRPQLSIKSLAEALPALAQALDNLETLRRDEIIEAAEIKIKYSGYIEREQAMADKLSRLENLTLRGKIEYALVPQLSTEARQKLERINPDTLGQASRIPGVSPSDLQVLMVLLGC